MQTGTPQFAVVSIFPDLVMQPYRFYKSISFYQLRESSWFYSIRICPQSDENWWVSRQHPSAEVNEMMGLRNLIGTYVACWLMMLFWLGRFLAAERNIWTCWIIHEIWKSFHAIKNAGIDYKQTSSDSRVFASVELRKGSWDPGRDQNGSQIGEEWKGRNPEQRKGGTKPWRTWRTQAKTKGRASWFILCWVTAMFFFWWGGVADDDCFVHWVVSVGVYPTKT